ncbi:MAG: hypothetical protein JXB00_19450 [Bacteroidales bacterium]|nr:hypothetical protein [Bacteroidales bacterium]
MKTTMKKKIVLLAVIIITVLHLNAQEDEIQTLFNGQPLKISGFGGPAMNFTTFNDEFAFMMGGGGGLMINNLFIGGYGTGIANTIQYEDTDDELSFGHGGFWLGYTLYPNKLVHLSIQTQMGWGKVDRMNSRHEMLENIDKIFVITPIIEAEMNVTRYFRIGLGGQYRIATLDDNTIIDSKGLSGPGVVLSFKFGWF